MRTLLELITIEMKEAFVKAGYGEEEFTLLEDTAQRMLQDRKSVV